MIKESLIARLALDKSEQEIVDDTLNKAVGEAVKTLLEDYNPRKSQIDTKASPTVYDPGQNETDMPGTSCTLSDLQFDSVLPSVTLRTVTHIPTITPSEEELRPKAFDWLIGKDWSRKVRSEVHVGHEDQDLLPSMEPGWAHCMR
jgi:hypothetical protein